MKFFAAVFTGFLLTQIAFGHAPFDSSARVIVREKSVEAALIAGTSLAENFLQNSPVNPRQMSPMGRPVALPVAMAAQLFEVAADGTNLPPQTVDVATDGTEFQFRVVCPLVAAKSLRIRAFYVGELKSPRVSPLVVTDENGNMLGSAFLSPENDTVEFQLPPNLFPQSPEVETNLPPAVQATPPPPQIRPSFTAFLKLGIGHILTGYDHLLFLCALLLGCRRLKPMLAVITGFTLAHSLTLAFAALDLVTIPSRVVEPLIAASIIFVAAENFRREEKSWHRYALTCGFGLVHGFGFASALRETGLAAGGAALAKPLLAFNLGVEIGQLAVAAVVLPLLVGLNKWPWFQRFGVRTISAVVILVAAFWLWQRITSSGDWPFDRR